MLHALAFGAAAALVFFALQCFFLPMAILDGKVFFLDPDSYTWCERAGQVLEGELFIHHDPLDNFPDGYESHWTQLFHWVLAFFGLIFSLFSTKEAALELAGVWICPLFGAAVAMILGSWAFRRWPWYLALLTVIPFLANPFELWTFNLGRPDHQCLLVFFLMAGMLILLDLKPRAQRRRPWLASSAMLVAAGVWISVQALSLWALLIGALILRAALASRKDRADLLKDALLWSATASAAALLFFLVERQGDAFHVVSDSISLGQVLLMAMPAAGLFGAARMRRFLKEMSRVRWFFFLVIPPLLLSLVVSLWLWSHHKNIHEEELLSATGRWFSTNLEFLPALFFVNGEAAFGRLHQALGYTLYALPFLLFGLVKTRLLSPTGKWILGVGLLAASLLTLWQMRWRDLHALLIAPALAIGLHECLATLFPALRAGLARRGGRHLLASLILLSAGALLLLPWIKETWTQMASKKGIRPDHAALRVISEWIRDNDPFDPGEKGPSAVLASWGQGPLVKYWSGRPVVAGPYHRNMAGILDSMRAYTAGSREAFAKIASKRRIRYVLRPPPEMPLHPNTTYELYTSEWVLGKKRPALRVRREWIALGGKGTAREYDLAPGMTEEKLDTLLLMRLEKNNWKGFEGMEPIATPRLDRILPDERVAPYLYRWENPH